MSHTETLTDYDVHAITNALRIAAEQFDSHREDFLTVARSLRNGQEVVMFAPGEAGARAADAMARQFEDQAKDARRIMDILERTESVQLTVYDDEEDE